MQVDLADGETPPVFSLRLQPITRKRSFHTSPSSCSGSRIFVLTVKTYLLLLSSIFEIHNTILSPTSMKSYIAVLVALLGAQSATAFVPLLRSATSRRVLGSPLAAVSSAEQRIKQAGGGIPLDPPGYKKLFDPATDGKLQGTGACDERILSAYQYEYLAPVMPPAVPLELDDAQNWLEDIGTPPPAFAKATKPAEARVLGRARKYFSMRFLLACNQSWSVGGVPHCEVAVCSHSLPFASRFFLHDLYRFDCTGCSWRYSAHSLAATQGNELH